MKGLVGRGVELAAIFKEVVGLRIECVAIDVLHTCDLGITAHILGNIMWECVSGKSWGKPPHDANVAQLEVELKVFYSANKITSKVQGKLSTDRLRTTGGWPKLKTKAAAARHLAPFALMLAQKYLDERRVALCQLLCRFYEILYQEGQFLSAAAAEELPGVGRRICLLYSMLAAEAAERGAKLWKTSPKLHLFQHVAEWQSVELGNPRFYWTYADEDLVGKLIEVAESCHAKTMAVTAMYKWLTLVFSRGE